MPTFRFVQGDPDESLFADLKPLNSFSEEQFHEFISLIMRFMGGGTSEAFMEGVSEFAESNGISLNALKNTLRGALVFFKGALKNNLTPAYVKEDLVQLGIAEEKAEEAAQLWKSHFINISRAASNSTLMVNELVDLEWRFGVTSATSEVFRVGTSFLQLKLALNKGGDKTEYVNMELTLPQFYQFFHEMEKAKMNLDFFS
ncbi:COMM domain-containing protein 7 [Balamuthia mandrillaris]